MLSQVLEVSLVYEIYDEEDSPEVDYPPVPPSRPTQQSHSVGSYSSTASDGKVCHFKDHTFMIYND